MKKILLFAFLFSAVSSFAQKVTFKEITHSFGKIEQNKPVTYAFKFTNNTGKVTIIENATAGCGCTTPEYPKAPIVNGKSGEIKVTFNAATVGVFTKEVTVKFTSSNEPVILQITGEVLAPGQGKQ